MNGNIELWREHKKYDREIAEYNASLLQDDEPYNQVTGIIYDRNYVVFVMKMMGVEDSFYWWWGVEKQDVEKYYGYPAENLTTQAAYAFCNDEDNANEGFSCASFNSAHEAAKDYFKEQIWNDYDRDLDALIDNTLCALQEKEGIESGDITPELELKLGNAREDLKSVLATIVTFQKASQNA